MIHNYTTFILIVIAVSTSFIAVYDNGLIPSVSAAGGYINSNYCAVIEAHPVQVNVFKTSGIRQSD